MALAKDIDYVIGVDTHKDSHSEAVVNATGGVVSALDVTATEAGYRRLLTLAKRHARGRRAWAVEGTGSYGSGLAAFLAERGERVLEIEGPRRQRQKPGKSDQLDAIAAARQALADDKLVAPRARGAKGGHSSSADDSRGSPKGTHSGVVPAARARRVRARGASQSPAALEHRQAGDAMLAAAATARPMSGAEDHHPSLALGRATSTCVRDRGCRVREGACSIGQ